MTRLPNPTPGSILIVRGGAIGDFIVTLPVLSALRNAYPKATLKVLGYESVASLAIAGGLADEVHSLEARKFTRFFAPNITPSGEASAFFAQFDIIISFISDPEHIFQRHVQACSKARFICGPHRPDEHGHQHATEVLLKPLEELGIANANPMPKLFTQPSREVMSPLPVTLAIHPGSGGRHKLWPQARWVSLLSRLAMNREWHFMLIGGEAEEGRMDELAALLPPDRTRLMYNLPLVKLARQLQQCSFFVGHDSGISHLAAALGLPGIVLWGPTNEKVWHPRSPLFKLIKSPSGINGIEVATVLSAVESNL